MKTHNPWFQNVITLVGFKYVDGYCLLKYIDKHYARIDGIIVEFSDQLAAQVVEMAEDEKLTLEEKSKPETFPFTSTPKKKGNRPKKLRIV